MIIKFSEHFFCPAPWKNMYYHINNATPCHVIKNNLKLGPDEYLKSDWLKNIKQDLINGVVPESCANCKSREDQGLKSTRGAGWNYFNTGPEPSMDISGFKVDEEIQLRRLDIRTTNLCNFKCRMCTEDSSSEIAKEKQKFDIPVYLNSEKMDDSIYSSPLEHIEELKKLCLNETVNRVVFGGGEPLLIKDYYDFMDFLIEHDLNKRISIELFSNCSVYNPKFVERLLKFKSVDFVMSIDGVGKTAEYLRHGTDWNVVKENMLKFNSLPLNIWVNTAVSSYVLLDASSLAQFLMELYSTNDKIQSKCYTVPVAQKMHHKFLSKDLQNAVINEIDKATEILTPKNYEIFATELKNIKKYLKNNETTDSDMFVEFTKDLDLKRGESFEDTYGRKLV